MVGLNLAVHPPIGSSLVCSISCCKDRGSPQLIQFNKSLTRALQHDFCCFARHFTGLEISFTPLGWRALTNGCITSL
jgi:hypothetical protein